VFTDGSGYQSRVGASAVCLRIGVVQRQFLGTEMESTVYAGELRGLQVALWLAAKRIGPGPVTVFTDSQAAIQAVQTPGRPSGQYLLRDL
jgi:ribonuclease HI